MIHRHGESRFLYFVMTCVFQCFMGGKSKQVGYSFPIYSWRKVMMAFNIRNIRSDILVNSLTFNLFDTRISSSNWFQLDLLILG